MVGRPAKLGLGIFFPLGELTEEFVFCSSSEYTTSM